MFVDINPFSSERRTIPTCTQHELGEGGGVVGVENLGRNCVDRCANDCESESFVSTGWTGAGVALLYDLHSRRYGKKLSALRVISLTFLVVTWTVCVIHWLTVDPLEVDSRPTVQMGLQPQATSSDFSRVM